MAEVNADDARHARLILPSTWLRSSMTVRRYARVARASLNHASSGARSAPWSTAASHSAPRATIAASVAARRSRRRPRSTRSRSSAASSSPAPFASSSASWTSIISINRSRGTAGLAGALLSCPASSATRYSTRASGSRRARYARLINAESARDAVCSSSPPSWWKSGCAGATARRSAAADLLVHLELPGKLEDRK